MLTILLVAAAGIAGLYLLLGRDAPEAEEAPTPSVVVAPAPAKPVELPCINERCAARPERLNCLRRDGTPAACVEWQVIWEDRCQCVERGPQRDGGTL